MPTEQQQHQSVTSRTSAPTAAADLLIYCTSGRRHHSASMNADDWPDELPVRSLCARTMCTRCGVVGADVRPDWRPMPNKKRV